MWDSTLTIMKIFTTKTPRHEVFMHSLYVFVS